MAKKIKRVSDTICQITVSPNVANPNLWSTVTTTSTTGITDEMSERLDALEKRVHYLEKLLMEKNINDMGDI